MAKYWIGCSGWQYAEWRDKFYPNDLPKKQWFNYYAEHFNTVEINSTFYHFPQAKFFEKWYLQAPKNFKYSLKMNRMITHYKRFKETKKLIKDFYRLTDALEEKLGCILFQLPPSMHYDFDLLERIIEQLDLSKHNVIEFRHTSWWQEEVLNYFKKYNLTFCSVSAPKLPKQIINTNKLYYGRFHGSREWFRGKYSKLTLQKFTKEIQLHNFKEVWAYFNNDIDANAPVNALEFNKLFL